MPRTMSTNLQRRRLLMSSRLQDVSRPRDVYRGHVSGTGARLLSRNAQIPARLHLPKIHLFTGKLHRLVLLGNP